MLKKLIVLFLIATSIVGCAQDDFEKTDSGLRYKKFAKGEGKAPAEGDIMMLGITFYDANGNLLDAAPIRPVSYNESSFERKGGIEEGITLMTEGDSIVLEYPIEDLYENTFGTQLPDSLERGSLVRVCVKSDEIISMEEFSARQQEAALVAMAEELEVLDQYLEEQNIDAIKHESGLRYVVTKEGTGPIPTRGEMVHVEYIGRFMDGRLFDSSVEEIVKAEGNYNPARDYAPHSFELVTGPVIQGWHVGIGLLKEGSKATLYIPSNLGYGSRGRSGIPPNSTLVFEVELVKIGS